jgi:polysaccharide export outer membrane protein
MRVSDLIRAGGSLNEAAYGGKAELTRNMTETGESRETALIEIDLAKAIAGDPNEDILLQPFDYLVIKELPRWGGQEYVEIEGEVRFPGRYPKQIEELTRRLQSDLAQVSLMAAQEARGDAGQALAVGQQLLENLKNTQPVGRLVINVERAMAAARAGIPQDIVLKDGDRLLVPRITQEVTVIGEVQSPTSHLFSAGLSRGDYIELSGGVTQRADKGRIYVVRADGSVVGGGDKWFSFSGVEIEPGDTVVVPFDAERMRALPLWTAITTIIYNLAVAVAAVDSFSD